MACWVGSLRLSTVGRHLVAGGAPTLTSWLPPSLCKGQMEEAFLSLCRSKVRDHQQGWETP